MDMNQIADDCTVPSPSPIFRIKLNGKIRSRKNMREPIKMFVGVRGEEGKSERKGERGREREA